MTLEYLAAIQIACAMRLDPNVSRIEHRVESPAPLH